MAFIEVVPFRHAKGELAEAYRYVQSLTPIVPKIMKIFSLRPSTLRAMARGWELAMWVGQTRRQDREFLAAAVSRANDCGY